MSEHKSEQALQFKIARNLSNPTISRPQMPTLTPRWLLKLLPWVNVEAGIYRINRTKVFLNESSAVNAEHNATGYFIPAENLRAVPMFADLDGSILKEIADQFKIREYNAGLTIVSEGEQGDCFHVIVKGKVELLMRGEQNESLLAGVYGEGRFFGEVDLYEDLPSDATALTLAHTLTLALEKTAFDKILAKHKSLKTSLKEAIDERIRLKESIGSHGAKGIEMAAGHEDQIAIPETSVNYEEEYEERDLSIIQTVLRIHTRITDLYNNPHDQLKEQLRLTIESMKEKQESEIINNPKFGLLASATSGQRLTTLYGPPTPDDFDALISRVWKKPAFFLAHPRAIAAFGRECTRRGVPPATVNLFGSPFLTWRGIPIVPCDKLEVRNKTRDPHGPGRTSILLVRTGEEEQGVIGLYQTGLQNEQSPGLSVNFVGINPQSLAHYMLTLYFSCAVLTHDALAVLENVEVGHYHNYANTFGS